MRMDQYVGLNKWATRRVAGSQTGREVGARILPGGRVEPFDREVYVPIARIEVIGRIKGAWDDHVADLHRYTLPTGRVYEEFVQATPWSSGPCYFIALKDNQGRVLSRSLWTDEELANA